MPSGASTGEREALELRDGDKARYSARACARRSRNVNGEIAQALAGNELRPARARRRDDRARRHADQEPPRRQRAARRVDGARCAPRRRRDGMPLYAHIGALVRRTTALHAAGADDEHPQRRRARRQQRRLPGIHGDAGRRAVVRRGAARRRRDLPRAARHPEGARPVDRRRRRRRLRAEPEVEPRGARGRARSGRQGRLQGRRRRLHRARRRVERALGRQRHDTSSRSRASRPHVRRDGRALRGLDAAVPDRLDRGRRRRGRLGRLEAADAARSATACSWSATMCSSPTRRS